MIVTVKVTMNSLKTIRWNNRPGKSLLAPSQRAVIVLVQKGLMVVERSSLRKLLLDNPSYR